MLKRLHEWLMAKEPEPIYPEGLPETPHPQAFAKAIVRAHSRNPVRLRIKHKGTKVRILGSVGTIWTDGCMSLRRNIRDGDPRVMCRFQCLEMVADLNFDQDIIVEGVIESLQKVEHCGRTIDQVIWMDCRWETP